MSPFKCAEADVRECPQRSSRLDVLSTLIDAYEAQHEPIDRPDPIEAIQFRMEQQGLTRKRPTRKELPRSR